VGIFSSIKNAIFGHKAAAQAPQSAQPRTVSSANPQATPSAVPQAAPTPAEPVDVEANLGEMAQGKDLNWRTSIVDLMKLIGVDSSLANRKELARELGYTGELDGSAEMNLWLHKATMRELAANGGKVPAELLD
jgi:hypothetical protein